MISKNFGCQQHAVIPVINKHGLIPASLLGHVCSVNRLGQITAALNVSAAFCVENCMCLRTW